MPQTDTTTDVRVSLHGAVRAVATACDGAVQQDGQGFNSYDRDFGHALAVQDPATWSPRKARAAWNMLRKYKGQLQRAGIDFAAIPEPPEAAPYAPPGPSQAEVEAVHRAAFPPVRRVIVRDDDKFGMVFRDADSAVWHRIKADVKAIPGAMFEPATTAWTVPRTPFVLEKLLPFLKTHGFVATPEIHAEVHKLQAKVEETKANVEASRATDAEIDVPGLGGTLRPFQRAGVAYAVKNERVLIGDEMGLGKTVQALAACQAMGAFPVVVVCPASLKVNWYREACKWLPGKRVTIWDSRGGWPADVVVVNYDVLGKLVDRLKALAPAAVVFDECHYLKTRKAKRTEAAKDLATVAKVRLALSGTPILNRPSELVTQLELLGRIEEFGGYWQFVRRYCQAFRGDHGVDTAGAANLEELNHRLRSTCFIRRNKADVLTELPPKQRSVVPLAIDNRPEYDRAEEDLIQWIREQALKNDELLLLSQADREAHADAAANRARAAEQLVRIEALKRLAARGKMAGIEQWVEDFLQSGEKLILFATHVDVVRDLAARFGAPCIYGETPLAERQQIVDKFQQDPTCRVIVLNIQAGGVGLTLTAASNVAFVEFGWNPGQMDQAEDRAHRIGQTDQVTAWYLAAEKTIDEWIIALIDEKRVVVTAATDGQAVEQKGNIMGDLIAKLGGTR